MKNSFGVEVVAGRWGYHAADYPTYLTVKALHRDYHTALRVAAARKRWAAKMPHNRKGPEPVVTPRMGRLLNVGVVSLYRAVRAAYQHADDVPRGVPEAAAKIIDYVTSAVEPAKAG